MESRIPGCVLGVHVHRPPEHLLEGVDLPVLGGHMESGPARYICEIQLLGCRRLQNQRTVVKG